MTFNGFPLGFLINKNGICNTAHNLNFANIHFHKSINLCSQF